MSARVPRAWSLVALLVATIGLQSKLQAQFGFNRGAVGGVAIDANGNLRRMTVADRDELVRQMRQVVDGAAPGLDQAVPVRRISLKRLEAACLAFVTEHPGQPLPDELQYLGGLLRIQHVIADPEHNDVILAGPAEGWRVDEEGNVVGVTTGRPVLQLDDLVVALRTVDREDGKQITCSIDPTEQGHRRLAALLEQLKKNRGRLDTGKLSVAVKQAYGPQMVRVTGVPATSHFAHVLVAADYRMKRLAMGLDRSPIPRLPNYISLLKKNPSSVARTQPRWWLAPDFDPIVRSEDGLAFAIGRSGVRIMTEDEYLAEDGTLKQTGRKSRAAAAFAEAVTERYDELSQRIPVFAELRNLMELATVAAIIDRYQLLEKSGASLPLLTGLDKRLPASRWHSPKSVPPECSIVRVRRGVLVTASGGVEIDVWELAKADTVSEELERTRGNYLMGGTVSSWWSN